MAAHPAPVSIPDALASLSTLVGRTPTNSDQPGWAAHLADVNNAGMYVVDYSGTSEWERHPNGDEIVMVLEGATTMFMLRDGDEVAHRLESMEFVIVPQHTWHRFETPEPAKIMTVTPQPTDHSVERPSL